MLSSGKVPTLVQNLVYLDKNSSQKELTISSKAESVESIVSSLVSQDNLNSTFSQMFIHSQMLSVRSKTNNKLSCLV